MSIAFASVLLPVAGCPGPEPYLPPNDYDFCNKCKPGGSLASNLTNPHRYACVLTIKNPDTGISADEYRGICMEYGASDTAREEKCDDLCDALAPYCEGSHRQGSAYWCHGVGYGGSGSDESGDPPEGSGHPSGEESGFGSGSSESGYNAPPWTPPAYVTFVPTTNVYEVDADFIDYLKTDPWALLNDSTYSEETPSGIQLRGVQTGTLADVLGFEEYDVIKSINNHEPMTFVELTDVYLALEGETSFTVEVTRGTQTVVLQFEIV